MSWDFQVVQITAAGTFGTVCVAFDHDSRRFYALKVLKERFERHRSVLSRTRDEAIILNRIRHENVLRVYELLRAEKRTVVVMEWLKGSTLEELNGLHADGLSGPEASELIRQAARGLHAAYHSPVEDGGAAMQVIHRDLKPSNLLVTTRGEVKVLDFGIARGQFQGCTADADVMVLGAREYVAPERLDGAADAPSLDVYSLGIVLYEMLHGEAPRLSLRPRVHPLQVRDQLAKLEVRGFSPEGVAYLKHLLTKMLAYDPQERPSARDVATHLKKLLAAQQVDDPLGTLIARAVKPIFEANSLVDPRSHDAYPSLAFLDAIGPTPPGGDPHIDRELRRFLHRDDWSDRVDALWEMLLLNPSWTARPFLEWLDEREPRWRFWQAHQARLSQRIALLRILGSRIDDEVRVKIQRFKNDKHPRVRQLAAKLLEVEEITAF